MSLRPYLLAASLALLCTNLALAAPTLQPVNQAAPAIQKQHSNAWLEIDKNLFENNIRQLQARLGKQTQLCAVMKADAYGHGVALLTPSILSLGVSCVAITSNEEARMVRTLGFQGRLIRIRTASLNEIKHALPYHLEEIMGNVELAQQAAALAIQQGTVLPIHLALNASDMSRNGLELRNDEGRAAALAIARLPSLNIVGIMTHFAEEDRTAILKDLARFQEQANWLIEQAPLKRSQLVLHTANSFATLEVPESHLDMVRAGGILYGDTIPSYQAFKKVMAFKTRIASINHYPAGNQVGYDHTYTLKRPSRLANLPVGYADGYRRVFSNKGYVLIQGQRAPVVGRVSMNTTMVDVSDIPNAKLGDEVVLFGQQGQASVLQGDLEEINGALLADLYTVWGNANPRILKD